MRLRTILPLLLLLAWTGQALANDALILTSPPRESAEAGVAQYGPIAEFASRVLGRPVRYEHPGNWLHYQRNLRNNMYDIVFDGPHFASWRMEHLGHDMLVKLPGNLQFYLLTRTDDDNVQGPDDLIGKRICGLAPPNLATLSVLAHYRNPVRQPVFREVRGDMGQAHKAYLEGECAAFVVRTAFFRNRLSQEEQAALKVVHESANMPNQVLTAGARLSADEKARLQQALLGPEGLQVLEPTLKRFAPNANAFVPATNEEYRTYNMLLEGVIFGW
jgi:hypothetical protein